MPHNVFYDIHKFPSDWGIIHMPISMSRISNSQDALHCIDYINIVNPSKISKPHVGVNIVYTDYLYLTLTREDAKTYKNTSMNEMVKHKNAFEKLRHKHRQEMQITKAFNFAPWSSLYLGLEQFPARLEEIRKMYLKDELFQQYVHEDAKNMQKVCDDRQIDFFLEEYLMTYLLLYLQVSLPNEYVDHKEKWLLIGYPGIPPRGLVYLVQCNPYRFTTTNPYIGQYNFEDKKFYDFLRIDLKSWQKE